MHILHKSTVFFTRSDWLTEVFSEALFTLSLEEQFERVVVRMQTNNDLLYSAN